MNIDSPFAILEKLRPKQLDLLAGQEGDAGMASHDPRGPYVIFSKTRNGFLSGADTWSEDFNSALTYEARDVITVNVVRWRTPGQPRDFKAPVPWYWLALKGSFSGIRGADWNGPFDTQDQAILDALSSLGPDKLLMDPRDARFVSVSEASTIQLHRESCLKH